MLIGSKVGDNYTQYRYLVILYSAITLIPGIGIIFLYKEPEKIQENNTQVSTKGFDGFKKVIKMKHTWLVAISIFTCYFVYSGLAYTSPYLVDVYGASNNVSSLLGIFRQYFASIIVAFLFGYIAYRVGSSVKIVNYSFFFS